MDTIQQLRNELSKNLTKKNAKNLNKCLEELVKLNYQFTTDELEKYVDLIIQNIDFEMLKIMQESNQLVTEHYDKLIRARYYKIILYLFEQCYKFTDKQLYFLAKRGYDVARFYFDRTVTFEIILQCLKSFKHGNTKIDDFKKIMVKYSESTNKHISYFATQGISKYRYELDQLVLKLLTKNMIPNVELLNDLLESDKRCLVRELDLAVDQLILDKSSIEGHIDIGLLILNLGVKPNMDTLYFACTCEKIDMNMYELIFASGLIPDAKCLDLFCKGKCLNVEVCERILQFKIIPTERNFKDVLLRKQLPMANMLIKYGYIPSKEDIYLAIENRIVIKGIERFDISNDEDIYYRYHVYNITLDVDEIRKFNITSNVLEMHILAKNSNSKQFTKYLTENNLSPDKYCLDITLRHNLDLFKFIINNWYCDASPLSFMIACNGLRNKAKLINKLSINYQKFLIGKAVNMLDQFQPQLE